MAETRLRPPTPPDEIRTRDIEKKRCPSGYTQLVYAVHPSSVAGCDRTKVAQSAIQKDLNAVDIDISRVIFIAPPEGCVYLNGDTNVTDIRTDASEHHWVKDDDIEENVSMVTLMGGNLELCLGSVFSDVKGKFSNKLQREGKNSGTLGVRLPLAAIYTTEGLTAQQILNALLQKGDIVDSVTALLTTSTHRTYSSGYSYGYFEVISSLGSNPYEIVVNGTSVATLTPPKPSDIEERPLPEGWVRAKSKIVIPDVKTILHIEVDTTETSDPNIYTQSRLEEMLKHARETVLPKYIRS